MVGIVLTFPLSRHTLPQHQTTMKHTLFLAIFAVTLLGGHVFAETRTKITDADGNEFQLDEHQEVHGNGYVKIFEDPDYGIHASGVGVYGICNGTPATVVMTGGEVGSIHGSYGNNQADNSTVILYGGKVDTIYGGQAGEGQAQGNNVILYGGVVGDIYAGSALITASDNKLILVGNGATYNGVEGRGSQISGPVRVADAERQLIGNALEVYGTETTVGGELSGMQNLNFHLTQGLTSTYTAPMLKLTSLEYALDLQDVAISVCGDEVEDWTAFNGKSITLLDLAKELANVQQTLKDGQEITFKDAAEKVLATATLQVVNEGKTLVLHNIVAYSDVPEPATGTLGLLALCALAARRKR